MNKPVADILLNQKVAVLDGHEGLPHDDLTAEFLNKYGHLAYFRFYSGLYDREQATESFTSLITSAVPVIIFQTTGINSEKIQALEELFFELLSKKSYVPSHVIITMGSDHLIGLCRRLSEIGCHVWNWNPSLHELYMLDWMSDDHENNA